MIDQLRKRIGAHLAQRDGRFRVDAFQPVPGQIELVVSHPFIPESLGFVWIESQEDAPHRALEWFIETLDRSDAVAAASEAPDSSDATTALLRGILKLAYEYRWHSTLRSQVATLLRECGVLADSEASWLAESSQHLP